MKEDGKPSFFCSWDLDVERLNYTIDKWFILWYNILVERQKERKNICGFAI